MGKHFHGGKRMNQTVQSGKTLLVDGPASVKAVSGKVEVFGSVLRNTRKVVIREGKRLPFVVKETTVFAVSLGENATVEEIAGSTIPSSWTKACEELQSLQMRTFTAVVLGTVDSGKTSFCTYLINKFLNEKKRVAILDGDLGQSDVGPPCTVAYAFATKPVTDLFNLKARNAFFVGVTSPSKAIDKVIEGLASLRKEVLTECPDIVIINTDGWVEGQDAINYKVQLVEQLDPDIVFYIQQKDELAPLLKTLGRFRTVRVDSPPVIRKKTREKRRSLRKLGYVKYLVNAKALSIPLNRVKIEAGELAGLSMTRENFRKVKKIYDLLGTKPLHFAELQDEVCIVIGERLWIDTDTIKRVEEFTKKKVVVVRKGEEQGLLAALYDAERKFLGIGVVREIDYRRKTVKIYTPASKEVSIVAIGRVKLDKDLREIPVFTEEKQRIFRKFEKRS
jgi:polynucleotide 5'-hydroxyl-kinase GRC3/NOL9